jgi:surfeit locus 1 family protein
MNSPLQKTRFGVVTIAAAVSVLLTFSLGNWQLRRAAEKIALQTVIEQQNTLPALDNRALLATKNIADVLHRRALLQGVWQEAHTVYLENRPMGGKPGFWVVTPLALEGGKPWILVQRGWVPRDFTDRTRLPAISTPSGLVSVSGRMAPPPSKLYEFEGLQNGRIRQNLDVTAFSAEIGQPLWAGSLLQTGPASEGLLRDWAAPAVGVDKHYGYAFQWFGLCALVAGLYVWFQLISPRRKKRHASSPQP